MPKLFPCRGIEVSMRLILRLRATARFIDHKSLFPHLFRELHAPLTSNDKNVNIINVYMRYKEIHNTPNQQAFIRDLKVDLLPSELRAMFASLFCRYTVNKVESNVASLLLGLVRCSIII